MIRLLFPFAQVARLAEHAVAAAEHEQSFSDTLDGTTPAAALWFVGDQGLYLMSNGLPHLPNPVNNEWSLVAYAEGYRTSADKHRVAHLIGGDDFCEVLPLLTAPPGGRILHTAIVSGIAGGATHFAIEIDANAFTLNIVASGPREKR